MLTLKNFRVYKPETNPFAAFGASSAVFLKDEDGNDWYEVQKRFATDTLKIAYTEVTGVINMAAMDADMLMPFDMSVTEVDAGILSKVDIHSLIKGEWMFKDGKIQPRIYTHAELEQKATWEKDNLLDKAARVIAPLQDAVDLDIATEAEKSALLAWKKYRVLLNRVDISTAPDIDWPEPPESGGQ
ncbi:tail fiber assembly protein [Sodalis sp.]|uniref:tail fiber assembly protein n=1 Tax=Sodalis sp. (in: enterobacteria) TaxID=1898979 RepID=UPI003873A854